LGKGVKQGAVCSGLLYYSIKFQPLIQHQLQQALVSFLRSAASWFGRATPARSRSILEAAALREGVSWSLAPRLLSLLGLSAHRGRTALPAHLTACSLAAWISLAG